MRDSQWSDAMTSKALEGSEKRGLLRLCGSPSHASGMLFEGRCMHHVTITAIRETKSCFSRSRLCVLCDSERNQ